MILNSCWNFGNLFHIGNYKASRLLYNKIYHFKWLYCLFSVKSNCRQYLPNFVWILKKTEIFTIALGEIFIYFCEVLVSENQHIICQPHFVVTSLKDSKAFSKYCMTESLSLCSVDHFRSMSESQCNLCQGATFRSCSCSLDKVSCQLSGLLFWLWVMIPLEPR